MKTRRTRRSGSSPVVTGDVAAVEREIQRAFTPAMIDELRRSTGYNPRQRIATAYRVVLTVVEAFLLGETLSFASLRAIFVRRFGFVRSCPFQKRFKQASAVTFFRAALERLVSSVVEAAGIELQVPLARFADVRVYDGTAQRVPPPIDAGAHVLMRLKKTAKVRVVASLSNGTVSPLPKWSLSYYLTSVSRRRGTMFDLDVLWGHGKDMVALRLVGVAHTSTNIRWYLTTVPRYALSARQVVQAYRLRWLVELLFRELKQNADIGRAFTGDANAVQALTYGAMLAHVLVRSLRIQAALAREIPLEQLRPTACLHVARAFAREIVDALAMSTPALCKRVLRIVADTLVALAREVRPSRSRPRIALRFGAVGA